MGNRQVYDLPQAGNQYEPIKDPPPQTKEYMMDRAMKIKQHRLGMNTQEFREWLKGHDARVWAGDMGFMPEWKGWLA